MSIRSIFSIDMGHLGRPGTLLDTPNTHVSIPTSYVLLWQPQTWPNAQKRKGSAGLRKRCNGNFDISGPYIMELEANIVSVMESQEPDL